MMTLEHIVEAIWRRRLVLCVALVAGAVLSFATIRLVPSKYTAQSSVLMAAEQTVPSDPQAGRSPIKPILSSDLPMLATTPTVLSRLAKDLGLQPTPDVLQHLQRRIKARLSVTTSLPSGEPAAGVLMTTFAAPSEAEALHGANALAQEITTFYRDNSTSRFTALIADLETQLDRRRARLRTIDVRINRIVTANPWLDPRAGSAALAAHYQQLAAERAETLATLASDEAAARTYGRRPAESAAAAHRDITESDPTFHNLRDQYARDYAQMVRLRGQYSSAYPGLSEIEGSVANERAAMLAQERKLRGLSPAASPIYVGALDEKTKADSSAAADVAKLRGYDALVGETGAGIQQSQRAATEVVALQRERDAATSAFGVISSRLAEAVADKAEAGSVGSVNVLDQAAYAKPAVYMWPLVVTAFVIVMALAIAAATLVALEKLDRRFHTTTIIEGVYGIPVVATLK